MKMVTPRFGDTDSLRHINNCMLPAWFELGRDPICWIFHPDYDYDNWRLIIARVTVDYMRQMRLGADVEIRTFIRKIGKSSFTTYQEAWQDGELGAKGDTVMVHYDFKREKSLPIPDDIRRELERHMVDENNPNLRTRSGRFTAVSH